MQCATMWNESSNIGNETRRRSSSCGFRDTRTQRLVRTDWPNSTPSCLYIHLSVRAIYENEQGFVALLNINLPIHSSTHTKACLWPRSRTSRITWGKKKEESRIKRRRGHRGRREVQGEGMWVGMRLFWRLEEFFLKTFSGSKCFPSALEKCD